MEKSQTTQGQVEHSQYKEKKEPFLPPWDCPPPLPVPGPEGFGQLTQPPRETDRQADTHTYTTTKSQMERKTKKGRQTETTDRSKSTQRQERIKVSVVTRQGVIWDKRW